jgi:hypothetical protein
MTNILALIAATVVLILWTVSRIDWLSSFRPAQSDLPGIHQ